MNKPTQVRILFICMGNICRSPTAEGVFRQLLREARLEHRVYLDSAGTHAFHVGESPDPRAQATARRRGVDLSDLRARQAQVEDFQLFDLILAMDQDNYHSLSRLCPPGLERKIGLLMDYAPQLRMREVPDPYYGGANGFERVFDLVEAAAQGLLEDIRRRL